MKRQSILSLVMALSFFVSMVSFPSSAQAQQWRRFRADTGVITLGMGQVLRITISSEGFESENIIRPRFVWMKYGPMNCNTEGVCLHTVQSHGMTAPVNLAPNVTASFDMQGTGGGVRVEVLADFNANGAVDAADAMIINTSTGEVVSHVIMANTSG